MASAKAATQDKRKPGSLRFKYPLFTACE